MLFNLPGVIGLDDKVGKHVDGEPINSECNIKIKNLVLFRCRGEVQRIQAPIYSLRSNVASSPIEPDY
jgi:hypothetical protein